MGIILLIIIIIIIIIKIVTFKWKHLVRSKIETDGSILEKVKQFNYLGCELSLDGEPDFDKNNKQIPRNMRHY